MYEYVIYMREEFYRESCNQGDLYLAANESQSWANIKIICKRLWNIYIFLRERGEGGYSFY